MVGDDSFEFTDEALEGFGDEVCSGGVFVGEDIGGFPLVDEILSCGVVGGAVVGVDSFSDLEVTESDSSCESTEVGHFDVLFLEELKDVVGVSIVEDKDLLLLDAGVVATVGNGAGVVV